MKAKLKRGEAIQIDPIQIATLDRRGDVVLIDFPRDRIEFLRPAANFRPALFATLAPRESLIFPGGRLVNASPRRLRVALAGVRRSEVALDVGEFPRQ